jgi:hypothetical protein
MKIVVRIRAMLQALFYKACTKWAPKIPADDGPSIGLCGFDGQSIFILIVIRFLYPSWLTIGFKSGLFCRHCQNGYQDDKYRDIE